MVKRKNSRGNGSIHLRKDRRWEGRYVIGRDEKGRPKTKNVLAKTKRECEQKLKELRASIKDTELKRTKADMTFGAWMDLWYQNDCFELLLLELSTGLRRGELLALRWDDLDFRTGELRIERQVQWVKGELTVTQPKTKASSRSIILPAPVLDVLKRYRQSIDSQWIFPSPRKEDSPLDPAAVRKKLGKILERAGCKHVRFHDLRHTFATNALEHGMDIKTLSAIIGHVSSATTLNVYAHVTDEMRQSAAAKIDRTIAKVEAPPETAIWKKPAKTTFQAVKGKYRKPGTGCVTQISEHLWEGRYSPKVNGKRMARNIYAQTEAECEKKLARLITEMKAEIAALRVQAKAG